MTISFTPYERELLRGSGIAVPKELTEADLFDLLDALHDMEIHYAQHAIQDFSAHSKSDDYARFADRIQRIIEEQHDIGAV